MKLRRPLSNDRFAKILSCNALNLDDRAEISDSFYECLDSELSETPRSDKVIVLGDFNARVGSNHMAWENVLDRHSIGKMNINGHRLLYLCAQNELFRRKH